MIVEGVPNFLRFPEQGGYDRFIFDRNGRFIYIMRYGDERVPIIIIYDIMFNSYV